jgi:hypothetical protein
MKNTATYRKESWRAGRGADRRTDRNAMGVRSCLLPSFRNVRFWPKADKQTGSHRLITGYINDWSSTVLLF